MRPRADIVANMYINMTIPKIEVVKISPNILGRFLISSQMLLQFFNFNIS